MIRQFAHILLLAFVLSLRVTGQNYVATTTYLNTDTTSKVTEIQYYDGLGRPHLLTSNGIGTNGNYVYTLKSYDQNDRLSHEWLPGIGSQVGGYQSDGNCQGLAVSTHQDTYPYTITVHDALDRPVKTIGAGAAWHLSDKSLCKRYDTNADGQVKYYMVLGEPANSLQQQGYYPEGMLDMEETTDEDGKKLQVFRDYLGRLVLERRDTLDTYYVYNVEGLLCYVLTPEYQKSGFKDRFAYQYHYDEYGQLEQESRPQCGNTVYYHDEEGRVIYMQNPTFRQSNSYQFFFYDNLGRQVIRGTCSNFNYHYYENVAMRPEFDGLFGTGYYYENTQKLSGAYPDEVTFYDHYMFLSKSMFSANAQIEALRKTGYANAAGLMTGSAVRSSTGEYLLKVIYYDGLGRVVDIRETLLGGGLRTTGFVYSFTNKPLTETIVLTKGATSTTIVKSYTYNELNDQLESLSIAYNGGTPVTVAEYEYNDLGQQTILHQGGNAGDIGFSYNLRGWTTAINGTNFKEWLYYTDGPGSACYNGNISAQLWQSGDENFKRGYKFSYDQYNRMGKAEYGEGDDLTTHKNRYTEWVKEYTMSGAIRKLERYGKKSDGNYGKIDNLRMYYKGLQVDSVKEDALPVTYTGAFDFVAKTAQTSGAQYGYSEDGTLKWDANKGISYIKYNRWGTPHSIQFCNGSTISYAYSALGEKQQIVHQTAVPNISVPVGTSIYLCGSQILSTDTVYYAGDFIFENGQLSKYLFTGGYISFANGQPCYHYYTKDHLGNIRAVVSESGDVEQTTHYYPFGAVYGDVGQHEELQRYKYNGKELDRMHGLNLYDYGARQYDPLLCRFISFDPQAEDYYHVSPYAYCLNNPVKYVDPDGKGVWSKAFKFAYKVSKAVSKKGLKALNAADTYTSVFSDVIDDYNTLTDANASTADRFMAGVSLASELGPISTGDIKETGKFLNKVVHGNAKASTKAQHAYDIINTETNKVVKTGVSGGKILKNGKSARAESQVRKWNKEAEKDIYKSEVTHKEPEGTGSRERILEYEKERANKLRDELDPEKHKRP